MRLGRTTLFVAPHQSILGRGLSLNILWVASLMELVGRCILTIRFSFASWEGVNGQIMRRTLINTLSANPKGRGIAKHIDHSEITPVLSPPEYFAPMRLLDLPSPITR